MSDELAIVTTNLGRRFGDHQALCDLNLQVATGSVHAVLGPNGAGKTTTIRILATLMRPTSGSARIFGHDVVREASKVRELIGLTGQYASLDEGLTARENLDILARLHRLRRPGARVNELLEEFSLGDVADRPIRTFSGGMRRRADIAGCLIARPRLIFLDEPTTGLDPRTRVDMWETVRTLVADGTTVLLTTQYLEEADELADRIAVIDAGRLVADDTADALKDSVSAATLRLTPPAVDREEVMRLVSMIVDDPCTLDGADLLVPSVDTGTAAAIVAAVHEARIPLESFRMERPSLDDVFFALTERRSAAQPAGDPA